MAEATTMQEASQRVRDARELVGNAGDQFALSEALRVFERAVEKRAKVRFGKENERCGSLPSLTSRPVPCDLPAGHDGDHRGAIKIGISWV